MNRALRAGHRWPARWPAALCLVAILAPGSLRADLWSLNNSVAARLESNDNNALSPNPSGTVNTLSLSTTLIAARRVENAATVLNAELAALQQSGSGASDRIDGRLVISQSFNDPRNSVNLSASFAQDFNSDLISADVTQGRGRRRTLGLAASWSHSLSERLGTSAQLTVTRAGYGQELSQATDFRNTALTGGLSYQLSEVSSATVQLAHSDYRVESGGTRSRTYSFDAGLSRAFSERASASLSLGAYRTNTSALTVRVACPVQVELCQAGLVPYIAFVQPMTTARSGLQFSTTARYQFDEVTGLGFSAGRKQAPSGAGTVVRSDTLSLTASRALAPTVSAALSYGQARSTLQGGAGIAQPGEKSLSLNLSRQLAPELSMQAGYRHSSADKLAGGQSARSNSFYVSLQYDWARLEASR